MWCGMADRDEDRPPTPFHRTGRTSPFGKLDDTIDAFRVSSLTKAKLTVLAHDMGITTSELMRLAADILAHGLDEVRRVNCEPLDLVGKMLGADREKR